MENGLSAEISPSPQTEQPITEQGKQPATEQSEQSVVNGSKQPTTSQNEQAPPASQTEQTATTQPRQPEKIQDKETTKKPDGQKDNSAESQNPQQQYTDQLPEYLKKNFLDEEGNPRIPDEIDDITDGQREVAALVLLEWCAKHKMLPPDKKESGKQSAILFTKKSPKITIDGSTKEIAMITGVEGEGEGKSFVCQLVGQEETVNIPVSQVIEAQKAIVEGSKETRIVKASALKKFLETAREQLKPPEGQGEQPLSEDKQQTLERLNELIGKLEGQLTPDQDTFVEALSLVLPSQQPAIQEQIQKIEGLLNDPSFPQEEKQKLEEQRDALQQILAISQEQSKELINEWVQKIYSGELSPKEIDNINNLLETGNIDSIQQLLEDKDSDSEETKKEKSRAASIIKGLKEKAPLIGGVIGILLLLMIFTASKSGDGHG